MIYWIIVLVILAVVIYVLYLIGKKVKRNEKEFEKMFNEQQTLNRLKKYKRKSTPKVPTINK